jgi:hypothetical protein
MNADEKAKHTFFCDFLHVLALHCSEAGQAWRAGLTQTQGLRRISLRIGQA